YLISDTQELQATFERYKEYYQKWIEQGNWIASERNNLSGKQALSQDTNNPSCPLCEQNLSQARKRFLHKKFEDQSRFLNHRLERLKKLITKTKATLHEQHAALEASKKIDELFKKQTELTLQIQEKEKQLKLLTENIKQEAQQTVKQTQELKDQETKITHKITRNKQYLEIKQKRETAEKQSNTLKPQDHILQNLERQLAQLDQQLKDWHILEGEKNIQVERKKQLEHLDTQIKQEQKQETSLTQKLKQYATLEQQLKEQTAQEQEFIKQITQNGQIKDNLLQQKGSLENQHKKLVEQAKLQKECERKAREQETYYQEYQAISQALSKDGIQALLIEEALPEIEQEANELLSRLTDNQTHIFIESLRDLKKGGTRETLDINISDSNGIRPYEMFSGGEAFRLDFALRIALSKLLARRAGTSLQTLIIDEGFGSQDEEGLSRIMDVLYKIQDDFEKIIIVSHLSSMKDQFPVHFVVDKQPQGSRVTIRELG
ncbi:MAG: exonuclease SbcC, partial [Alteromonas naphthalenivorans]